MVKSLIKNMNMKVYKLLSVAVTAGLMLSCTDLNNPLEDINISVQAGEAVTVENNMITVSRNTPIQFNIAGEPDNITFFSGETGHNYDYRNRTQIAPEQIKSSVLNFQIENQYGTMHKNLYNIYVSETFPGLYKDNFEDDCKLLESFSEWQDLILPEELPEQSGVKKDYTVDLYPYLGKSFTFAIHYHPVPEAYSDTQPKVHFRNFKITNELQNGKIVEIMPSDLGLTPVNLWSANLEGVEIDSNLKKNEGYYDGAGNLIESALWYGTVTNNIWGMWNMKSADTGYFFVHSTAKEKGLRPSWLVSDYLEINKCEPDNGVAVKNISNRLEKYEYTYSEVGTYKAVFVLNNANYKEEDSRIITMVINVK